MRASILFSLPLVVSAIPTPEDSSHTLSKREDKVSYYIDNECRKTGQYDKMLHAVQTAREMAKVAVKQWWDEGKHQEVAATYLAIPNDGKYKDNEYAQRVAANLKRITVLDEAHALLARYVQVGCRDQWKKCDRDVEGTTKKIAGYAENFNLADGHHYDIVLCPPWYRTDNVDALWDEWEKQPKKNIAMDWLESDAGKVLHEFMHINEITQDRPHIVDQKWDGARVYTAPMVAKWVEEYKAKTSEVVQNADSYTQFVNAIHFKNKFGYLPPPGRDAILEENKECYGGGDGYVDNKYAAGHINDFCAAVLNKYKKGSNGYYDWQVSDKMPDHFEFKVTWDSSGHWASDRLEDNCRSALAKAINDCDKGRWKFGGAVTFKEVTWVAGQKKETETYTFSFTPKSDRPQPIPDPAIAYCKVAYKVFYNQFDIWSGLWAGNDHGQDRLLPELRGCGLIKDWHFEYHDEWKAPGEEWHAWGTLPIGPQMWGCVANAIHTAGGPSGLKCS